MFEFLRKKNRAKELKAMVNGDVVSVTEVPDDVFSSCMLGKGIAIHPADGTVVAPADGEISVVMEGTNHAVGIKIAADFNILIHIGLDTVGLGGEGFTSHIRQGQKIHAGDKLITFDKAFLESRGLCTDVIMIVTDSPSLPAIDYKTGMRAEAGETVVASW